MSLPSGAHTPGAAALGGTSKYAHGEIEALPAGTRLSEFEIVRVLGMGGFGIVYLALDTQLQRQVALKEYLPASMAGRGADGQVFVRSRIYADTFIVGLRSFVNEARLLARFDHPSLVKVHRFWEANGTAYMVMPYYDGATLKAVRQSMNSPPDEAWLKRVLESLLGALEVMHAASVYHRDVAPDNILLLRSGQPVLLDFGAARHVLLGQTQTLTAMLKPAYAPLEQYAEATEFRQGPWTDIYATAATLHYCLTGRAPPTAAARAVHDSYEPLRLRDDLKFPPVGRPCDPAWLAALDWGLELKPQRRPQSVAQWREVLAGRAPLPPLSMPQPDPDAVQRTVPDLRAPAGVAAPAAALSESANAQRSGNLAAATKAAAARRAAVPRMTFRQAIPWILWVLAAFAVAGTAIYFQRVGAPPAPGELGQQIRSIVSGEGKPAVPSGSQSTANPGSLIPPEPTPGATAATSPTAAATTPEQSPAGVAVTPQPGADNPAAVAVLPALQPEQNIVRQPVVAKTASAPLSVVPKPQARPASSAASVARAEEQRLAAARRAASAAAEAAGPQSPSAVCGNRVLFSLWNCMRTTCESSRWVKHPQCVEWAAMEQRNAPRR